MLALFNITLPAASVLPAEWGSSTTIKNISLERIAGLVGTVPASWVTGMPALEVLMLRNVTGLTAMLPDYISFINQPARMAAASNFTGIWLDQLSLQGSVPPEMFYNRR